MLAGVLLHMVAPSRRINHSTDSLPLLNRADSEMENPSIFFVDDLRNCHFPSVVQNKFSGIMYLPTAGGIKRRTIQHHGTSSLPLQTLKHTCVEAVEKGVVIIKAFSHFMICDICDFWFLIENPLPNSITTYKRVSTFGFSNLQIPLSRVE